MLLPQISCEVIVRVLFACAIARPETCVFVSSTLRRCRTVERCAVGMRSCREVARPAAVIVRGLRYALPTEATRITYLPDKYCGLPVLTVIASMWRLHRGKQPLDMSMEYWSQEIAHSRVLLRRSKRQIDDHCSWLPLKESDLVMRGDSVKVLLHQHERVVPAVAPRLLAETQEVVVVDKPAGLACSSHGKSDTNSLKRIACEELKIPGLQLAHRLDACVTGCLVMARTRKLVQKVREGMQRGNARKSYLARVEGKLPMQLQPTKSTAAWRFCKSTMESEANVMSGGQRPSMRVDEPLSYDGHAARTFVDRDLGRPCSTIITFLTTLSDGTHLLHCQPRTGHKHQLRCHLAWLGLPVANDRLYGGLRPTGKAKYIYVDDEAGSLWAQFGPSATSFRSWCPKCEIVARTISGHMAPPELGSAEIWLRSWRYSLDSMGVDAAAPLPAWANQT